MSQSPFAFRADRYRTRFLRDGTVNFWDVFAQEWARGVPADRVPPRILATLPARDRARIAALAKAVRP